MKYVLGEPPRTSNEAFDALDRVLGGDEFSQSEAEEVLEEVLDMSSDEATREFRRLTRMDVIEEA